MLVCFLSSVSLLLGKMQSGLGDLYALKLVCQLFCKAEVDQVLELVLR